MPLRRTRNADDFGKRYGQMLGRVKVPDGQLPPTVEFDVNRLARDWVKRELSLVMTSHNQMDAYNVALILGGFCRFATHHGFEPFLAKPLPDREHRNLPPMPTFQHAADDVRIITRPSAHGWSSLEWALGNDVALSLEQLVDDGVRVLGALAVMPDRSGVAIRDDDGKLCGTIPRIQIAGAAPYPPEVAPMAPPPAV